MRRIQPRRVAPHLLLLLVALVVAGCGGSSVDAGLAVPADAAVQGRLPRPAAAATPTPGGIVLPPVSDPGTPAGPEILSGPTMPAVSTADHPLGGRGPGPLPGPPAPRPDAGMHRSSCAGFHNQTGITADTVTLANVADISGPVPGIFTSAQQAVRAYVAYFNATSDLCGRKLVVEDLDSRTDALGDQLAYTKACADAFAAVGSMSAFDDGGAATAQGCGLPDIRATSVADARNNCTTCFGVQATQTHAFQNAVPDFFVTHYRESSQHAAMFYVDAAASVETARIQQAAEVKRGMRFVYSGAFDVADFNYGPYVQRMKQAGVRWLEFVGSPDEAVRLGRTMQAAGFRPDVYLLDPTAYDPQFVAGGSAVNGAFVFINFTPFEESAGVPELQRYRQWLQQVSPGAVPTYFGLFAWSAARLFVEEASDLGGTLSRATLLRRIRTVHAWTDDGVHSSQDVGGKTNGSCWRFLQLRNGVWHPVGGRRYLCHGSTIIP